LSAAGLSSYGRAFKNAFNSEKIVKTALIVIDVQRGFVNDKSQHVVPKVIELIRGAKAARIPLNGWDGRDS
jgi:hypothetical protein